MKNLLFISLLFLVAALSGACSPDTGGNSAQANKNAVNAANLQDNTPPVNPDANIYPLANAVNAINAQNPQANKQVKPLPAAGRILPDGSEILTELRDVPIETRTFKGHPQLLKVVKSGMPTQATVKIYLKSGKIIEIPGEKVPNLSAAQASDLLTAAGVKPEAPRPADTRPVTKKVEEKP
jgi:hypothetical protein